MAIENDPDYKLFFERMTEMLCIIGSNGFFKGLNDAWATKLGWSLSELYARPWLEFLHTDDRPKVVRALSKTMDSPLQLRLRFQCKDGRYRSLRWNITPVHNDLHALAQNMDDLDNGETGGLDACVDTQPSQPSEGLELSHPERSSLLTREWPWRPISGSGQGAGHSCSARESGIHEARLLSFIEDMPVAMALFDPDRRSICCSKQWLMYCNSLESPPIGSGFYDAVSPSGNSWQSIHQNALAGKIYHADHDHIVGPDGRVQRLRWDVRPWCHGEQVAGVMVLLQDVTHEIDAQAQVQQEKEKFDAIAQNIPLILAQHRAGSLHWINPHGENILGWSLDEMRGRDVLKEFFPELEQRKKVLRMMSVPHSSWLDLQMRGKTGEVIYTSWANVRLSSGDAIAIGLDLTSHIQDRKRIEQSEAGLRALVEASPDYIVRIDPDFRVTYTNRIQRDFENTQILGRSIFEMLVPEQHEEMRQSFIKARETRSTITFESQTVTAQGKTVWFQTRIIPLIYKDNRDPEVMFVSQDVTQQRDADERIRTLASMIEASQDVYGYFDPCGKPLYINLFTKLHFGWSLEAKSIADFVPSEVMDRYRREVFPYLESGGHQWEGEVEILNKHTGERVPVWQRIVCLRDKQGKIIYFATVGSDLRQKKNVEMRLIQASKMATLGEMAGGVAHEINNPLAIIHAASRKMSRELESHRVDLPGVFAALKTIEETSMRIARIVKGLRAFARDESQEQLSNAKVTDILNDILTLCTERFKNHGVDLQLDPFSPLLTMACRPVQVSQILLNLLSNSFDAIESLPEKWIRIGLLETENAIQFVVTDSGRGIPEHLCDKIMNPFFTTKVAGKGTGLGLSIAKAIAQSHGGSLVYDSNWSNTRFILSLRKIQEDLGCLATSVVGRKAEA